MLLEMMVSNPTLTGRKVAYEFKNRSRSLPKFGERVLGAPE